MWSLEFTKSRLKVGMKWSNGVALIEARRMLRLLAMFTSWPIGMHLINFVCKLAKCKTVEGLQYCHSQSHGYKFI